MRDQHIGLQVDQLFRGRLNSACIGITPAIVNSNIAAIVPAEFLKALLKYGDARTSICIAFGNRHQHTHAANSFRLLSARRERPRSRCAAEQCDELAPLHFLTPRAQQAAS
jgi:hypothetical protein